MDTNSLREVLALKEIADAIDAAKTKYNAASPETAKLEFAGGETPTNRFFEIPFLTLRAEKDGLPLGRIDNVTARQLLMDALNEHKTVILTAMAKAARTRAKALRDKVRKELEETLAELDAIK